MGSALDLPMFHDDEAARAYLENLRWPDGVVCPHCGVIGESTQLHGKRHRPGLYKCNACRKQFSVTVGTVFEHSKVPLHKWMLATYLLCASKKGMSAHQLHRMLGVTYKTAWFMAHRIRESMSERPQRPIGGWGKTVECDETFWGRLPGEQPRGGFHHMNKIVTLVDREAGARSFVVQRVTADNLRAIINEQVLEGTRMLTDDAGWYKRLHEDFPNHLVVKHSAGDYGHGEIHTNTVEGFFATMKRGLDGVYQHVGTQHLPRYLSEFDFRFTTRDETDLERANIALQGIAGKRLYYKH